MTLLTMTIPDDPAEVPRWLERRLMAPDFGRFVAELAAHFPAAARPAPAGPLLNRWLPVALVEGLDLLPSEVLNHLLKHPAELAAFQERIVTDGGGYWDEVLDRSDDASGAVRRGKRSLERMFSADAPPAKRKVTPSPVKARPAGAVKRTGRRRYKTWAVVGTGVAACLAVAVGLLAVYWPDDSPVPKAPIAWGWGKPAGLAADQKTSPAYLNKLAANAEEWTLHQPSDPAGVRVRIAEFRTGCTRLMQSTYGPLTPADKAWLLDRCRAWAKTLDGHLQALDAGTDPLTVRAQVDETVRAIAAALREKAKDVG